VGRGGGGGGPARAVKWNKAVKVEDVVP